MTAHDPALVERVADAIWRKLLKHETGVWSIEDRPLMDAVYGESCEFFLSPGEAVREMAVAALDAIGTTTLVRYAILGANEDAEDIGYAQIHDDEQWAATVARRLTKRQAKPVTASDALLDAPFRCVELRIEVIDPREAEGPDV